MEMLLLTLYKQHYLDQYNENMETDYSCLGYYDGLNITNVDERDMIFPMSGIWQETGARIRKLSGRFSNQNIGLIRCGVLGHKWEDLRNFPFMALGFVKIKDNTKASELFEKVEEKSRFATIDEDRVCEVLTYYTFDNADLVVLVKSNSLIMLEEVLRDIEEMEEVTYLHSIWGIDETYLNECMQCGKILDTWNEQNCHINEDISTISIQLATSGDVSVLGLFKKKVEEWRQWGNPSEGNLNKMLFSYIMGHGNINIKILGSKVRTLILFLLPNGVLTHRNGVYGYGLYNIETEILIKERDWIEIPNIQGDTVSGGAARDDGWCNCIIGRCEDLFDKVPMLSSDDGLYSYFRALIQTLNTLAQYESFTMSRDIFELIVPSFQMFEKQLNNSISGINDDVSRDHMKYSLMQYLECVNSVIYHTIHTDQVYLMIPGYSGTSFSIPIKLSMFYSWFIEKTKSILNDTGRSYSCIIQPVMESRPVTCIINMNPQDKDMLICVKLAQHSLYKPSELFIILSHEIAHYVNRNSRKREVRCDCIVRTLAYTIAEGISQIYLSESPARFSAGIAQEYVTQVKKILLREVYSRVKGFALSAFPDGGHSQSLAIGLKKICREVLSGEGEGAHICDIIHRIPETVINMIDKDDDRFIEQMRFVYKIQKEMDTNRRLLIASLTVDDVIDALIVVYKEVFSDVAAATVLKCHEDQFIKAFTVSEGAGKEDIGSMKQREHWLRIKILREVLQFGGNREDTCSTQAKVLKDNLPKKLYNYLYNYVWVQRHLLKYAQLVHKDLTDYLLNEKKAQEVEEIRQVFRSMSETDVPPQQKYLLIEEKIEDYKKLFSM